jgi:zinc carboxypeptidase
MLPSSYQMNKILIVLLLFITSTFNAQSNETDWLTYFEKSNYLKTPNYDSTIAYFQKISDYTDQANLMTFGFSPQGRELKCMIAAKEKEYTYLSNIKRSDKPIVLILNGIHSGEIEGKDANMLLLREILVTKEKQYLLDNAILMVIPVFNVDGHERSSPYSRINQNGPKEMGWRTTAQNLNLNRDFMKADALEMRAFLTLFSSVLPDIFIDVHTSDGVDYQYTITYQIERHGFTHPMIENWANEKFISYVEKKVEDDGFLISPFVGFVDGLISKGMYDWIASPRFSNGYASLQNRPGLLIETHMLKPYKERVFATKSLLTAVLEIVNDDAENLLKMNSQVDDDVIQKYGKLKEPFPFKFERTKKNDWFNFKGLNSVVVDSKITGGKIIQYTNEKVDYNIPYLNADSATHFINPPNGYIVPVEWKEILGVCKAHGIRVEELNEDKIFTVEKIIFKNVKFATSPYEGRFIPSYKYDKSITEVTVPKGSYYIPCEQRTVGVILNLFEPDASDSFMKWGFFNIIFERKEYYEDYSMGPIAERMLAENIDLKREFEMRLFQDDEFKNDPNARLNFFYERSPYYDQKHNVYPILRVIAD